MNSFQDFQLPSALQRALGVMNFNHPTPIQTQAIPVGLAGHDLIGLAQTGTGKTAAFCIPMLVRLLSEPGKTALILAPTRELALQIEEVWKSLAKFSMDMNSVCLIGGMSMQPQYRAISRRPRVIIATPGRLVDHLNRRTVDLSKTSILVLDEADRMLDMGFAPQLSVILKYLPQARQTLLFSATWASDTDALSKKYLKNPTRVSVGSVSQAMPKIKQAVLTISSAKKNDLLLDELNRREGLVLVFARTQARTDRLSRYLESYGMSVARIHGGRSQAQRVAALSAFKTGKSRVLLATDIAARGIDVTDIAHVINYDLPMVAEDYIHRIGRTGRNGAEGNAVSLLTPEERGQWKDILKLLQKTGSAAPDVIMAGPSAPREKVPAASPFQGGNRAKRPDVIRSNSPRPFKTPFPPSVGPKPSFRP